MLLRLLAIIAGIVFIFAGAAGFLPDFFTDGLLFGYFETNTLHNLLKLSVGVIAIMAATSYNYAKLYFQAFGIIFSIAAIVGFVHHGDLFILHTNMADNLFNLLFAIIAIYLGFFMGRNKQRDR